MNTFDLTLKEEKEDIDNENLDLCGEIENNKNDSSKEYVESNNKDYNEQDKNTSLELDDYEIIFGEKDDF